jgi:hypothetical protein
MADLTSPCGTLVAWNITQLPTSPYLVGIVFCQTRRQTPVIYRDILLLTASAVIWAHMQGSDPDKASYAKRLRMQPWRYAKATTKGILSVTPAYVMFDYLPYHPSCAYGLFNQQAPCPKCRLGYRSPATHKRSWLGHIFLDFSLAGDKRRMILQVSLLVNVVHNKRTP